MRKSDLKHFLLLILMMAIGFFLFWSFNFNRQAQMWIAGGLGAGYVLWGVTHHKLRGDLHWRIFFEYLAVAMIASVMVILLLGRA